MHRPKQWDRSRQTCVNISILQFNIGQCCRGSGAKMVCALIFCCMIKTSGPDPLDVIQQLKDQTITLSSLSSFSRIKQCKYYSNLKEHPLKSWCESWNSCRAARIQMRERIWFQCHFLTFFFFPLSLTSKLLEVRLIICTHRLNF